MKRTQRWTSYRGESQRSMPRRVIVHTMIARHTYADEAFRSEHIPESILLYDRIDPGKKIGYKNGRKAVTAPSEPNVCARQDTTVKHHQVRTKFFSPDSRCVPTNGSSQTGLCNKRQVRAASYVGETQSLPWYAVCCT